MRLPQLRGREDGQGLVEVALVLPLFIAMLFGIIDIGRVVWANDALANAAREGARYASVHAGTPELTVKATKDEIKARALGFVVAAGTGATATVCFSAVNVATQAASCSGDTNQTGAGYGKGNLVTVEVTSHVPVLTGAVFGFSEVTVTGKSTVLINN